MRVYGEWILINTKREKGPRLNGPLFLNKAAVQARNQTVGDYCNKKPNQRTRDKMHQSSRCYEVLTVVSDNVTDCDPSLPAWNLSMQAAPPKTVTIIFE